MQSDEFFAILAKQLDIEYGMQTVRAIWEHDRFFDFAAFRRTAGLCLGAFEEAGLEEIESLPLVADGRTRYGDWLMPRAWYAGSATLTDSKRMLADRDVTPTALVMHSAATPPGGLEAEVVAVDPGCSVDPACLAGRLLLTSGPVAALEPLARSAGAAGILTDHVPLVAGVRESRDELRGHSRWDYFGASEQEEIPLVGFSLAPEVGDRLRAALAAGPVRLTAHIEARFAEDSAAVVAGLVRGTGDEEVLAYAHLYEPGAIDNASGAAALITVARSLQAAIASGQLPRPLRSIRFVLGWECIGSTAWLLAHPGRRARTRCALVADMLGAGRLERARLRLWRNPVGSRGFADMLLRDVVAEYRCWCGGDCEAEEVPFDHGSDNIMGDPCWGIPTVGLFTAPTLSYHSSLDRPDRLEPAVFERDMSLVARWLWRAASLDEAERLRLDTRAIAELAPEFRAARCGTEAPWDGPVYRRTVPGVLTFAGRPELRAAPWRPAWNVRLNLPLFWMDGKRGLDAVIRLSSAEAGEDEEELARRRVWLPEYAAFLEKHGYLERVNGED